MLFTVSQKMLTTLYGVSKNITELYFPGYQYDRWVPVGTMESSTIVERNYEITV